MLREYQNARQVEGEPRRRWFGDRFFELIVWESEPGQLLGFQLCNAKGNDEHAVAWKAATGLTHHRVDDGESSADYRKKTPILVPDGELAHRRAAAMFKDASAGIDPGVADLLLEYARVAGG
jgi:hypothetical protein